MGGRGASSGISDSGKEYGTEYTTVLKAGNIKFVRYNDSKSAKAPLETMTKGRVYVTINAKNKPAFITYYDTENKRNKTIDLIKPHNGKSPHVHLGYEHGGKAIGLSPAEKRMVDLVNKIWHNNKNK